MKAEVKYFKQKGLFLFVPRDGLAPLLFMEWISGFGSGDNPIQHIRNNDCFEVKLNLSREKYNVCVDYINNNS